MQDLSEKLQKVFVKTKKGQKEFIVFKKTLYPFKIFFSVYFFDSGVWVRTAKDFAMEHAGQVDIRPKRSLACHSV